MRQRDHEVIRTNGLLDVAENWEGLRQLRPARDRDPLDGERHTYERDPAEVKPSGKGPCPQCTMELPTSGVCGSDSCN